MRHELAAIPGPVEQVAHHVFTHRLVRTRRIRKIRGRDLSLSLRDVETILAATR